MSKIYTGYERFLYEKFNSQHTVKGISRKTGIPEPTLYCYTEGRNTLPVDLVAPLYNATKDVDFLNFIIDDTDRMLVNKQGADARKSVLEETLDVASSCGRLVGIVQKAKADGEISRNEKRQIVKAINLAEKELEDLREKIR